MITDETKLCQRRYVLYDSNGLDEYIVDKCYTQAQQARKCISQ
jgi:hypothetical protein